MGFRGAVKGIDGWWRDVDGNKIFFESQADAFHRLNPPVRYDGVISDHEDVWQD